jgi:phosphoadenosine phosphosulfate reductase
MTLEGNSGLEEKTASAVKVIEEALRERQGAFAVYLADSSGLVLLHLLKTIENGKITIPVLCLQFQPLPTEVLCFVDKLMRMWGFYLDVERTPVKPDGSIYTEDEMSEITEKTLVKLGARRVISAHTGPFEDGAYSSVRGGCAEFRPLYGFDEDDILEYSGLHRLPLCSLDKIAAETKSAGQNDDIEDAALREKLRSLGYI